MPVANPRGGTLVVRFDPSSPAVSLAGSVAVFYDPSEPTVKKSTASTGTYTGVEIVPMQRQIVASNSSRKSVILVHDGSNTLYIGLDSSITTGSLGNSFLLVANQIVGFDDYTGAIFGALDSGDVQVKFIEI